MNWMLSEEGNQTVNSFDADTFSTEYLCTNSLWCPGAPTNNNPNTTVQFMQILDNTSSECMMAMELVLATIIYGT